MTTQNVRLEVILEESALTSPLCDDIMDVQCFCDYDPVLTL